MPITLRIQGEAPWLIWFDQASKHFIARCDQLSLTASGPTQADMMAEMAEATQLLFVSLLAHGDLDQFLGARGWTRQNHLALEDGVPDDLYVALPQKLDYRDVHAAH